MIKPKTEIHQHGVIATQAFALGVASDVRGFMEAAAGEFSDDDGYHIWFQMEPENNLLWAVMNREYWLVHHQALTDMAELFSIVATET